MSAPVLETPRLRLRGHVMADIAPLTALLGSARARFMGGPVSRKDAWLMIASEVGSWSLNGLGSWGIEDRADGTFLGQIAITHPPHFPETEIGWTVLEQAEGQGVAAEAALTALDWAWTVRGLSTLVSYIDPENTRSIKLATKLGAQRDDRAARPDGETVTDTLVYRHLADTDGSPEAYA